MRRARNLYEFDDVVTGPLHGYLGADDYWKRASAKPLLRGIRVPTLLFTAQNDPFCRRMRFPMTMNYRLKYWPTIRAKAATSVSSPAACRGGSTGCRSASSISLNI